MKLTTIPKGFNENEEFKLKKFRFTKRTLTPQEKQLLRKRGTKLKAWMDFTIRSQMSEEDKHFIKVCEGKEAPVTKEEKVWFKYQDMCKDERALADKHREELRDSPEHREYIRSRFQG